MPYYPLSPRPGRSSSPFVGIGCYILTLPLFGLAALCLILGQAASSKGDQLNGPISLIAACVISFIAVACLIAALYINEKEADKQTAEELAALQEKGRKIHIRRRRIARSTGKQPH